MRKIYILKAIVELLWIVTMPIILLIPLMIFLIFNYDLNDLDFFKINDISLSVSTLLGKVIISILLLSYGFLIYSLYLFKKTLRYFLQLKIFDNYIIISFHKIGVLLTIWGMLTSILTFFSRLYFKQKIVFSIGLNEHIVVLCLGLFFMILSEVFKIAKNSPRHKTRK